jgi:hypothetical protein
MTRSEAGMIAVLWLSNQVAGHLNREALGLPGHDLRQTQAVRTTECVYSSIELKKKNRKKKNFLGLLKFSF